MRTYWLPLILLLATPFRAAADTVLIPLHHVPVTEVERQLLLGEDHRLPPGALGAPVEQGLIPAGITAWTADPRRNAFEVAGTEQAIQSFQRILQLFDVPDHRVQLSVRILPLTAVGLDRLRSEPVSPVPPDGPPPDFSAATSPDQWAILDRQPALSASDMTVGNNHALHLLWAAGDNRPPAPASVTPRVNGDGSVTLIISRTEPSPAGSVVIMRRLSPGRAAVVLSHARGTALVVEVGGVRPPVPVVGH